jgi:hypothetical protein
MQVAPNNDSGVGQVPSSSHGDVARDEVAAGDVVGDDDTASQSTGCGSLAYAACLEDEGDADSPATA